MAAHIGHNFISVGKQVPYWEHSFFGLTFERDPRPRCALILGDGFTQGFLGSQNLRGKIRLSIDDHFPPPEGTMYIPVKGDCFEKSYLWDQQKWPRLYKFWEESNRPSGRDFYLSLPKVDINQHIKIGKLSYDTKSLGFELRCYLWHLFRSHHCGSDSSFNVDIDKWEWCNPFKIFLSEFSLGVASFNYDFFLEFVLNGIFRIRIVPHDLGVEAEYLRRPSDSVALYKMHGSISYYVNTGIGVFENAANPWLSDIVFEQNFIGNTNLGIDYNMETFPEFPDIVPPGHYGGDRLNPRSTVLSLSKGHIRASKLVVFCGLSAEEPDTDEVKELVDEISTDAMVIQVGLECDRQNKLAQLLLARGLKSTFLLPSELSSISEVIGRDIPLHRDWSKL